MRKSLVFVGVATLVGVVALVVFWRRPKPAGPQGEPEVLRCDPTEVTLAWASAERSRGSVRYQRAGSDAEPAVVREPPPPTERHEVVIRGLDPGTRYRYGIGEAALERTFETQPLPTTPFAALVTWGEPSDPIASLTTTQAPGFILSLTPVGRSGADPFGPVRSQLPIFGPTGPTSTVLERPAAQTWPLDWGGLRLVVTEASAPIAGLLRATTPHTFGLVVLGAEGVESLSRSDLQSVLKEHNRRVPARPVGFVLVPAASSTELEADGIVYLGVPTAAAGALRLDVGPDSTVAVFVDSNREVVLRQSGLARRRTCQQCRQLADRGAYEESVKAYQEFIASHEGHFQIDDAHYAIAEILDEKLFRHAEAVGWYEKLIEHYPDSTLVPLARQRLRFLAAHDDHDFEPLARFERIRKVEFSRRKGDPAALAAVLADVQALIDQYPDGSLAPEMSYWLANQYRALDPDRAAATYRQLIADYPDYRGVDDARIEIGETYYAARRNAEAIAAFREAKRAVPNRAAAIDAQIRRAERNQRRGQLAWMGWIVLAAVLTAGASLRPTGVRRPDLRWAALAFVPLWLLLLLGGWLIHEQFKSSGELLGLSLTIAAAACFGHPFVASLATKLWRISPESASRTRMLLASLTSVALGFVVLVAGSYLALFHLNEHYLTGLGL